QRAAATGRPLCAPCAMKDITQKKYRERNVLGNSTEQPFIQERNSCKVIADIYISELRGGKWQ
ncbi:hypothetical protein, partial [Klebsiella aerogenes]|uniref:hypothetical protein n=1 Tax=Klebsiella aerogenes TaxID=548 RepID=UPI000667FFE5